MTYVISGLLIIANFISSLLKGKGKLLSRMLLVFMWILFWGSYNNADYLNYRTFYDYVSNYGAGFSTSDVGFVMLARFAAKFGLEYHHFLMILSFVGIYLITETAKKYSTKPQLVYMLYFIHPYLLDVVQIRNFFAMAIIIYCFRYIEQEGIGNNIKFVVGVLIAFSIHAISILFLPIVLLKKLEVRRLALVVFIVLLIGIPLAYSNFFQIVASKIVGVQRVENYFINRARFGFLIQFFIQFFIFLMIHYSKVVIEKRNGANKFVDLVYKTNLYLITLFPLYIINGTFERGFRMIMILNYIVFSKLYMTSNIREKGIILGVIFVFAFLLFSHYIFMPYRDTVLFPIFQNNLLFD